MNNKILTLSALATFLAGSLVPRFNKKDKKKMNVIDFAKARKVDQRLAKSASKEWLQVVNVAGSDEATIYIYDEISWFGVLAEDVLDQLEGLDVSTIHVRINSPGGSVFEGVAIANILKASKAKVITYNDSLCASIATIIYLAGDERHAAKNSLFMIHKPMSGMFGNAEELRSEASVLDIIEKTLVATYSDACSLSSEEIAGYLTAETWFASSECMELGFSTELMESSQMVASADLKEFNFSAFINAPEFTGPENNSPAGAKVPVIETPSIARLALEVELLQLTKK